VREHGAQPVPSWLISGPRPGRRRGARGAAQSGDDAYDYPHERPGHLSPQELLPAGVAAERFYRPDEAEAALRERLEQIRRLRGRG
jgi:putative ATPase